MIVLALILLPVAFAASIILAAALIIRLIRLAILIVIGLLRLPPVPFFLIMGALWWIST